MGFGPLRHVLTPGRAARAARTVACAALLALSACGGAGALDLPRDPAPRAPAADLAAAERLGGHTLARHVGRTDDELRERLWREPGIAAASTYPDRRTAERIVAVTLQRSARRIEAWSARAGSRPNLALDYRGQAGETVGRSLRRGDTSVRSCPDAVVVLRWHASGAYYVLTSYPECRP